MTSTTHVAAPSSIDVSKLARGEPPGGFDEIHLAARNRDGARIAELLAAGADPNLRNQRERNGDGGNTPLWFAAQGARPGGVPVARVLLDAGARIDERCEYGTTALHLAASWGHLDLVEYLVENGADIHVRDDKGETSLESLQAARGCIQEEVARGTASADAKSWLSRVPPVIDFLSRCETPAKTAVPPSTRRRNFWLFTALAIFAIALAIACFVWMQHVVRANGGVADPQRSKSSVHLHRPTRERPTAVVFALPAAALCFT